MVRITPKNWKAFQHYGTRRPPWIKLHRSLLDDFAYACLPIASKALAPCLWLLASESEDAVIEASVDEIAFRVRMNVEDVKTGLKHLIDKGFFVDASGVLASSLQDACLEKETEREKEVEKEKNKRSPSFAEFDRFWSAYPRKVGKGDARRAWSKALKKASAGEIIARAEQYAWPEDRQFIPHPATWLNAERWTDELVQPTADEMTDAQRAAALEEHFQRMRERARERGEETML